MTTRARFRCASFIGGEAGRAVTVNVKIQPRKDTEITESELGQTPCPCLSVLSVARLSILQGGRRRRDS